MVLEIGTNPTITYTTRSNEYCKRSLQLRYHLQLDILKILVIKQSETRANPNPS